jgi:hypothetical protein
LFNIELSDVGDGEMKQFLSEFTSIIAAPLRGTEIVLVLAGTSPPQDFSGFLARVIPILWIYLENYMLRVKPRALFIAAMNKIRFYESSITSDALESLDFVVTNFSEVEQSEIVLHFFAHFQITELYHVDLVQLTELVKLIEKAYTSLPHHDWQTAIARTQFVYVLLTGGKLAQYFEVPEIAALLFAALCQDVGHQEMTSSTIVKCDDPISFVYGTESTLEKHKLHLAATILLSSSIATSIDNRTFWTIFSNGIIGGDLSRAADFATAFSACSENFDRESVDNRIALARLMLGLANVSEFFRPNDYYVACCKAAHQARVSDFAYVRAHAAHDISEETEPSIAEGQLALFKDGVTPMLAALATFLPDLPLGQRAEAASRVPCE